MYSVNKLEERPSLDYSRVEAHMNFLKEKYYKIDSNWPQFKILFKSIESLIKRIPNEKKVLILERSYFCGGYSLFAPLFHEKNVIAIDCVNSNSDKTFGNQKDWLSEEFIKWRPDYINSISNLSDIKSGSIDFLIVPNVVHHEMNQIDMFKEFERVLNQGGECLIFEGLVRELHHMPNDYVRYTHEGLKHMLINSGLEFNGYENGSGVFDVISYVWQNALEYLPDGIREDKRKWFFDIHFKELQELDNKYKVNLMKPEKSFPMSYVVWAKK